MKGADCAELEGEEQAVLLVDDASGFVTVVQPNEDGSYWRKIVRNKMIRMKEKRRVQAAQAFAKEEFAGTTFIQDDEFKGKVVASYGPYTSIVGTAKKTSVAGMTAPADFVAPVEASSKWSETGQELADAFNKIDVDGSGSLSMTEVASAIKLVDPSATDMQIGNWIAMADADGNGEVSLKEFVMMMIFRPAEEKEPVAA